MRTYVLSLDIPLILSFNGVLHYLINKIINACLIERTSLQWYGTRLTENMITKEKEVCLLSPNVFVIMLHALIETVTESLGNYDLSGQTLTLSLFLGYAEELLKS